MHQLEGIVTLKSSRNLRVDTPEGELLCSLRGRFRLRERGRSVPVVGDRVLVSKIRELEGVLEKVLPRRSEFERATAGGRSVLVAANVDRLLVMLAARQPPPRWPLVDRMLVEAHRAEIEPGVCLNKRDQVEHLPGEAGSLEDALGVYRSLGYSTFAISATRGEGLESLTGWLRDRVTALAGHSGVGKSTLLNRLAPGLDLKTLEVNRVTGKGRHATTLVRLLPLSLGGYALDTPGFREFQPVDLPPPELGRHYVEFHPWLSSCRFKDCLHRQEPGCKVREAVQRGDVPKMRYDNYLQILSRLGPEKRGGSSRRRRPR